MKEIIKHNLIYQPDTGKFYRVLSDWRRKQVALTGPNGYRYVTYNRKIYYAHRLAFYFMESRWPKAIDHINNDKADNRWFNLREANQQNNCYNRSMQSNNTSGIKGVSWNKEKKMWKARIWINKKETFLGYFKDANKAKEIVCKAREDNHGEFYNHG